MSFTAKIISNTQTEVDTNTQKLVIEIEIKMDPEPEQLELELVEPKLLREPIDYYGICDVIEDYLDQNNRYITGTSAQILKLLKDYCQYDQIQRLSSRGFSRMLIKNLKSILKRSEIEVVKLDENESINEHRWLIRFRDDSKVNF